jgi:hypothetical protein
LGGRNRSWEPSAQYRSVRTVEAIVWDFVMMRSQPIVTVEMPLHHPLFDSGIVDSRKWMVSDLEKG